MYRIETKDYGYKLTFKGSIREEEMNDWVDESLKVLNSAKRQFGVVVDMRLVQSISNTSKELLICGQRIYKAKGMIRSSVVMSSIMASMQIQAIAQVTRIFEWERYINACTNENWEEIAVNWAQHGIEPEQTHNTLMVNQ